MGHRIGYLIADVLEDKVLVRTFVFLTMHGTPESEKLYRRLGARRIDIDRLHLDHLDTFLASDLKTDPQLKALLEECDCGRRRCRHDPSRVIVSPCGRSGFELSVH